MKNILTKKFIISLMILITLVNISFIRVSFAESNGAESAINTISTFSTKDHGIMPCDPYSNTPCTPKDAVKLFMTIGKIFIYITIIVLILMLIIGGVGYVFSGDSVAYLNKWKKYIKNSMTALLWIVLGSGLVIGILTAVGMKSNVLEFIRDAISGKTVSFNNFSIFPRSMAQGDISSIVESTTSAKGVGYTNFFPDQSVPSLILLFIKFAINYFAAPLLVFGTIWSGVLFVGAQGNPEKLVKAKKFAVKVIIGIVIAAAAYTVVSVILNTINQVAASL